MKIKSNAISCLIVFVSIIVANAQKQNIETREYIGKIKVSAVMNGIERKSFHSTVCVWGHYTLESVKQIESHYNVGKKQQDSYSTTVLKGYVLTNWKSKTSVLFDTSMTHLQIKKTYGYKQKPKDMGILNFDEKPEAKEFTYWKDSIIESRKVKLFIKKGKEALNNGQEIAARQIIYMNPSLSDFPVHSIDKYLDKKYNGYSFRRDYKGKNGGTMSMRCKFIPGLKDKKIKQIKRMIQYSKKKDAEK